MTRKARRTGAPVFTIEELMVKFDMDRRQARRFRRRKNLAGPAAPGPIVLQPGTVSVLQQIWNNA